MCSKNESFEPILVDGMDCPDQSRKSKVAFYKYSSSDTSIRVRNNVVVKQIVTLTLWNYL